MPKTIWRENDNSDSPAWSKNCRTQAPIPAFLGDVDRPDTLRRGSSQFRVTGGANRASVTPTQKRGDLMRVVYLFDDNLCPGLVFRALLPANSLYLGDLVREVSARRMDPS